MLPASASRISASVGCGTRCSKSCAATTRPGVQKPHCTAPASTNACRTFSPSRPSIVTTERPLACPAWTRHAQTSVPSRYTDHDPAVPQILLVEHALDEPFGLGRTQRRRPGGTDAGPHEPSLRIERDGERADGDDHRVPRADLAELLRARRRFDQERRYELVLTHRVSFRAGEELADGNPPCA